MLGYLEVTSPWRPESFTKHTPNNVVLTQRFDTRALYNAIIVRNQLFKIYDPVEQLIYFKKRVPTIKRPRNFPTKFSRFIYGTLPHQANGHRDSRARLTIFDPLEENDRHLVVHPSPISTFNRSATRTESVEARLHRVRGEYLGPRINYNKPATKRREFL